MRLAPLLLLTPLALAAAPPGRAALVYAPGPPANPLKGLVPYLGAGSGQGGERFPHALEFDYFALGKLVAGPGAYDWSPLEAALDGAASRGHQLVIRVYLEYPDKPGGIPSFLVKNGLKVHKYLNTNTQPLPPAKVETPDYADPNLRRTLREFVAALGAKYDGDPRLGYVTAGLLGTWGEWHTYPRDELFAKPEVQREVLDAYEAAFRRTPVLLRYPAGPKNTEYAANDARPFGYHDDSFAWATLPNGKPDTEWHFLNLLSAAGPKAASKWKTHPVGGEIRPEAWGKCFDADPGDARIQDFTKCVEATHATWLMESSLFDPAKPPTPERRRRAVEKIRRLGYEFHAKSASVAVSGGKLAVEVEIENRGVAPFYAEWTCEYGLFAGGKLVRALPGSGKLSGLLPGDPARVWSERFDLGGVKPGTYTVGLRVPNALPTGPPVRFANAEQDALAPGWLALPGLAMVGD